MWPFKYPYSNFHELNLDWILEKFQKFSEDYDNINDFITNEIEKTDLPAIAERTAQKAVDSLNLPEMVNNLFDEQRVNYSSFVNVKDYGAKGDGVTDDTSAINSAFLANGEGCQYIFPRGVYLLSNSLSIPANSCVCGSSRAGVVLIRSTNEPAFSVNNANVAIKSIHIDGRQNEGYGIETKESGDFFRMKDCSISNNTNTGIIIRTENCTICDCVLFQNGTEIGVAEGAINTIIRGCYLMGDSRSLVGQCVVIGDSSQTEDPEGTIIESCVLAFHHVGIDIEKETLFVTISNCVIDQIGDVGISNNAMCRGLVVTGCYIGANGTGNGVVNGGSLSKSVFNGVVFSSLNTGLNFIGTQTVNCSVVGCTFMDIVNSDIGLINCQKLSVVGCQLDKGIATGSGNIGCIFSSSIIPGYQSLPSEFTVIGCVE